MPIRRVLIVLILFLGTAAGCGGGGNDEPTSADVAGSAGVGTPGPDPTVAGTPTGNGEPHQEGDTGDEPETEGQGPEKPAPKTNHPYAKLAPAPVGSNDNSTGPVGKRFCVGVSLLRTPPEGLTVKTTGIHLNRDDFRLLSGTCQGRPSCRNYTFTSENGKCSVVVVPKRSDPEGSRPETRLTFSGNAYCAANARTACAEWARAADNENEKFIKLFLPSEPAASPSVSDGTDD
jgi:hypothetical protein